MVKQSSKRVLLWSLSFTLLAAASIVFLLLITRKDAYSSTPYTNTSDGYSLKIPTGWSNEKTQNATLFRGKDTSANIEISVFISKTSYYSIGCGYIAKDSEKLSLNNDSAVLSSSYLSFFSMQQTPKTLCGIMATGTASFKADDAVNTRDYSFTSKLPELQVAAQINNLDSSTNFPALDTALNSKVYDELIFILKSLQYK